MVDTPRNSSMCVGEARSHAARAAESSASSGPSSFATNHSPACSAIAVRTRSSLKFIDSTQPRHAASTMTQTLRHVLLRHLRRYSEVHCNLPEGQSLREAQLDRCAAFRTQLLEHHPEPRDPLPRIELPVEFRQRLELLMRRCLVDVDAACLAAVQHRVLLHQV